MAPTSSSSSSSDDHEMPEPAKTQASTVETQSQSKVSPSKVQGKGRKRVRGSKKDIPGYTWTVEATQQVVDFIKEWPQLYDKKEKEWLNVAAKARLWTQSGAQLDPPATGDQCKKLYENMRTRLGKILNKDNKSGSGQPNRTTRDDEIVTMWEFLKKHIVRGETVASDTQFVKPGTTKSQVAVEELEDDLSSVESEDLTSTRGKSHAKKYRRSETPISVGTSGTRTPVPSVLGSTDTQSNLNDALRQVLSRADTLGQTAAFSGQRKIVHDFTCLLEGHMQRIPEESWHNFEIECLNLVQKFRQPAQPSWQTQQQPVSWQSSRQSSQQWPPNSHWSGHVQWPPANQGCYNPVMPAAPSAVPVEGPSRSPHPPVIASSMTTRRSNELVATVFEELREGE